MLKFKTVTKAVHNKDLFKFHALITEYGQVIFDKLDAISGDSNTENMYFLLLTELWNEKETITEHIAQFDDYIDFKLDLIRKEAIVLKLEKIKSFPSLTDENIDLSVLKQREIVHRNERVINYILIDDFKSEVNDSEFKFAKVVPTTKRAMECNGLFYTLTHSNHYCFFVYLATNENLYVKSLNIKFKKMLDTKDYSEYNLNSLGEVKIIENEHLEPIAREFRLDFTDSKPLVIVEEHTIESRDIKNYILDYAKEHAIPVADYKRSHDFM